MSQVVSSMFTRAFRGATPLVLSLALAASAVSAVSAEAQSSSGKRKGVAKLPGESEAAAAPEPAPTPTYEIEEQKEAYKLSGIAKRQQGKYREAVDDLTIFVSGNDRDSDGHWELALAYAHYNDARPTADSRRRAVEQFRRCFELSPGLLRVLPKSAKPEMKALLLEGKKQAGVLLEDPVPRNVDGDGLLRLAETQVDSGDLLEAKKNYDDLKGVVPPAPADRERVRTKLDVLFRNRILKVQSLEATNLTAAQNEAASLLRYFPDEPVALETYVRLQMRFSKMAMEGMVGQKIFQTFRNSIEGFMMKSQFRDALSDVNRMLFNFPRSDYGERKYEEILQRNEAALLRASEAFKGQRYEEARRLFEEIRRDYPDPGIAQDAIGEIDEVRRKLEQSLEREQERGNFNATYAIAKELSAKFPTHPRAQEAVKLALDEVGNRLKTSRKAIEDGRLYDAIGGFHSAQAVVPGHTEALDGVDRARGAIREVRKKLWGAMEQVTGGRFILGGGPTSDTRPKNKNATLETFFLDRYKVSNEDYRQFVLSTGAKLPDAWKSDAADPARVDFPVAGVSYAEAEAYCGWIGKRLPTELEWEKAARGPEGLDLPYENAPGRVRKAFNPFVEFAVNKHPELASPYKIEGMISPVFEWTSSWYGPYPGSDDAGARGTPRETFRVARGGSRSPGRPSDKPLEATFRERRRPEERARDLGFRCAASVAVQPETVASDPEPEKIIKTAPVPAPAAPETEPAAASTKTEG